MPPARAVIGADIRVLARSPAGMKEFCPYARPIATVKRSLFRRVPQIVNWIHTKTQAMRSVGQIAPALRTPRIIARRHPRYSVCAMPSVL